MRALLNQSRDMTALGQHHLHLGPLQLLHNSQKSSEHVKKSDAMSRIATDVNGKAVTLQKRPKPHQSSPRTTWSRL